MGKRKLSTCSFSSSSEDDGDKERLTIGLDFGTTFSGLSYCFTGSGTSQQVPSLITDWPGASGKSLQKVPTRIQYCDDEEREFYWGYEVDLLTPDKLEGFKLLLDSDAPRPLWIPAADPKVELERLGKPLVHVIADFIGAVYSHATSVLESQWPKEYLAMYEKQFVLSVPAVWSDAAKEMTLQAAHRAGLAKVELVKEPEAAALYTFQDLKFKSLKAGDAFVVCDAGGGTMDLISYEVTSVSPFRLKELVAGTGGFSGSLMLNKRFEDAIEKAVGRAQFEKLRGTEGYRYAMRQFDESIKTNFNPITDRNKARKYLVSFPGADLADDPSSSIEQNCFTLTTETMAQIFKLLVENIVQLVQGQISSSQLRRIQEGSTDASEIKAIFLVGGFGSSSYLKALLQQSNPGIQVLQPRDAWSAIARGAVLRQCPQEAFIESTIAVRHYGVSLSVPYKSSHAGQPKYWCDFERKHKVNKMTWYILRGDRLERNKSIRIHCYGLRDKCHEPTDLIFEDELIDSEAITAPKYPREGASHVSCRITSDLRRLSQSYFSLCTNEEGKEYYEITYDLVITTQTANLKFSMEIEWQRVWISQGRLLGRCILSRYTMFQGAIWFDTKGDLNGPIFQQ